MTIPTATDANSFYYSLFNWEDSWTEADFEDVAAFLRDDYKIVKVLEDIDQSLFRVDGKSVENATENAKFIRTFFLNSNFIDIAKLEKIRELAKKSMKEKNKTKKPPQ